MAPGNLKRLGTWLAAMLVAAGAAGAARAATDAPRTLTVFAAASLAGVAEEIARGMERETPGLTVRVNAAGSQQLAAQIEQGAAADLFLSADETWVRRIEAGGFAAAPPEAFAGNHPVVIVSRSRGGRIRALADLARPGVKLVLGAPAVPIGRYAREAIATFGAGRDAPPDFATRALANVVSEEESVNGVASKVRLGEADAGIVYVTDVTPALAPHVRVLEFPARAAVRASCWQLVLRGPREADARAFAARLRGNPGRRALVQRGFTPAAAR